MRVVVNPQVCPPAGGTSVMWHNRRLVYQAEILRRAGYDVAIHNPEASNQCHCSDARQFVGNLATADMNAISKLAAEDVYLCSVGYLLLHGDALPPLQAKIIAWTDSLCCNRGSDPKLDRVNLFVSWICKLDEFPDAVERLHSKPNMWNFPKRQRMLSVPFVPHDVMIDQFVRDGLRNAFLDDDLEAIRAKYRRAVIPGRVGFIGGNLYGRSVIASTMEGIHAAWTDGNNKLSQMECLGQISECDAVVQLPGDTFKCARQMETVVMGRPMIQKRGLIDVTPPLTDANTILVDEWSDMDLIRSRLAESASIVAEADRCYKEGWSLRGQILTAIKRVSE